MAPSNEGPPRESSASLRQRFSPLFVLAPARSCSSLVVAMLGQHPQLYAFPELRLFCASNVAELFLEPRPNQATPVSDRVAGLLRALAQLHDGEQTVGAVERAYGWLQGRRSWTVESVLDHLLQLVSPLIGVEKSPETSRTVAALQRASTAYPKARILHLVRHPWSTAQSMLKAWSSLRYWNVDHQMAPQYCLNVWLEQHRRIATFGESLGSDQLMRIRSEDIVNEPFEVLLQFCRWMGIDDSDDSLQAMLHPERSPYACHGPMNARGGYDPKFLADARLRPIAIPPRSAPNEWHVDDDSLRAVAELARHFGYDCNVSSLSPRCSSGSVFRRIHPIRLGLPRRR